MYEKKTSDILVMIDVDHFKQVNDSFGHAWGDRVLQETAQVLQDIVGQFGIIGRYGGEEFCLLLPVDEASAIASKLRQEVAHHTFRTATDLRLTVSIGIATYPKHATQWTTLLECADKALYDAKRQRNMVKLFAPNDVIQDTKPLGQNPVQADV
ncbi:GGDEF domain-containing protein [Alicyclobacillus ferrooxydans]|uniref:GGDEF domain-containing protein n=1 Tax=Alicyclobacillus ferrooxydans TaxID=471514 RepID=UPI00247FF39B|nr:GGDEF domain-containing protein [Alicyclobacillus ferrooxydans]